MVQAMALLPEHLRATLKLAAADFPENLYREVSQYPGWARVQYLGLLSREGLARLLGHVRAGLVVLYPEPKYVRGMPIKLFEYMSAGIPAIASDFPLFHLLAPEG
jgi:glycosyltransferase involved in cell wall biosynthesis